MSGLGLKAANLSHINNLIKAQNMTNAVKPKSLIHIVKRFFDSIQQVKLINFEYNAWNGFIFTILGLEYSGETKGFEGDLIGLHFSKTHLIIYLVFVEFEIKSPIL